MEPQHEVFAAEITAATQDVFSTMLGIDINLVRTAVEEGGTGAADGVAGLVGLAGEWAGTGCISCGAAFACQIAHHMLMADYDSVCDDVLDAMGEIANMVIGNVKTNLEERLGPMGLSIPTVVYGHNFATRSLGRHEWTVAIFEADGHQFQVQLMLMRNPQATGPARPGFSHAHQLS